MLRTEPVMHQRYALEKKPRVAFATSVGPVLKGAVETFDHRNRRPLPFFCALGSLKICNCYVSTVFVGSCRSIWSSFALLLLERPVNPAVRRQVIGDHFRNPSAEDRAISIETETDFSPLAFLLLWER
ncbi:MAG: hypothetical protein Q6K70_11495, partial [Thermostichales cyanobacterium DRC_bins_46]